MNRQAFSLFLVSVCAVLFSSRSQAKELDQFTDRLTVLAYYAGDYRQIVDAPAPAQVDAILDTRMNALLDELVMQLRADPPADHHERDERVRKTFQHPLLAELITPYEEWAKHEAPVPLYKVRDKGIYGHDVDYDDMRITWYIELSPIIQVAGVTMGLDKLGHYLAQGFQYYEHWQQLDPNSSVAERAADTRIYGHDQEVGQLGISTGGVYSPADLAANWEGMLFFLALFDDVQLEAATHARYITHDAQHGYRRARAFHWSEWVSADWDEVQNPSRIERRTLFEKVRRNFWRASGAPGSSAPSICQSYLADPRAFLGTFTARSRSIYEVPERARAVAPYVIDVRAICQQPVVSGK